MKNLTACCVAAVLVAGLCLAATGEEAKRGPNGAPRVMFQKADANKDGTVTFEEMSAAFPNMQREKFDQLDRDKDGTVSRKEVMPAPGAQYQHLIKRGDTNNDGKLTLEEAQAVMPKMTGERFSKIDRNGDGFVSVQDAPVGNANRGRLPGLFGRADTDGDGKVSKEEFMAGPNANEQMFKRFDRNGDGYLSPDDIRQRGGLRLPQPPARPQTFDPAQLDKNGDGKLSYEEATDFFPPLLREAFDRLDANKDGYVTMDEVARPEA